MTSCGQNHVNVTFCPISPQCSEHTVLPHQLSIWSSFLTGRDSSVLLRAGPLRNGGPGSSVGIATDYGLDGPGSNPGVDEIFRLTRPALGAHPASCKMGTGSFPGVKCGRGVLLATHPLLVPGSWKSRAIPLPTLWATTGLQRDHSTFYLWGIRIRLFTEAGDFSFVGNVQTGFGAYPVYRSNFTGSSNGWGLKLTIQPAYSAELRSDWICTSNFRIMSCNCTFTGLSAWNSFLLRKLAVARRVKKKKPVLMQIPAFIGAHKTATCATPHPPHTPHTPVLSVPHARAHPVIPVLNLMFIEPCVIVIVE